MRKKPFSLDERDVDIVRKICTVLYFVTIYSLVGVVLYREYVLHQEIREFEDIAIIMTFNVLVFLGALLYIGGGVNPRKIKLRYILAGYGGFVLLGFGFTIFRYTVLLGQELTLKEVLDYFFTVVKVSGLLVLVWGVLAYLGSRRIEKQIE